MIKCSAKKGGYAETTCKNLDSVLEIHPTARSKGMFVGEMINIESGKDLGSIISVKSGDHIKRGFTANFCPFCGGELRDSSSD